MWTQMSLEGGDYMGEGSTRVCKSVIRSFFDGMGWVRCGWYLTWSGVGNCVGSSSSRWDDLTGCFSSDTGMIMVVVVVGGEVSALGINEKRSGRRWRAHSSCGRLLRFSVDN
jgi:hypothetical protein